MKTNDLKKTALVLGLTLSTLSTLSTAFAAAKGGDSGGGGDALEGRVNEIRSDLLTWISNGGAKELALPADISYGEYSDKMSDILENKKVALSFTYDSVKVKGVEKTCRGSFVVTKTLFSEKKTSPQILCNITRFKDTAEAKQYALIHHEYAGLVNVEKNDGSASDYEISNQITDFLRPQTVLKLAVVKKATSKPIETDPNVYNKICREGSADIIKSFTDRRLQAFKDTGISMIKKLYTENKLKTISKITLVSVEESKSTVHREFAEKTIDLTYRIEAQEDSANLMITAYINDANLIFKGHAYENKDALGRLLEKGVACSVESQTITEENYTAPLYRDHYVAFIIKNLDLVQENNSIGIEMVQGMNYFNESFKIKNK